MAKFETTRPISFHNYIFIMAAAFAGVVFGMLGSLGFINNYLNTQFTAQTAALNERLAATSPNGGTAAAACYQPTTN